MSMENLCIENKTMDNSNVNMRITNNRDCNIKTRKELDYAITKISFAMDDTRLYLDTHPNCMEALEYFKKLQIIRHGLIKEYTEHFGTIYSYNIGDCDNWNWNESPLPWTSSKKGWC